MQRERDYSEHLGKQQADGRASDGMMISRTKRKATMPQSVLYVTVKVCTILSKQVIMSTCRRSS